MYRFLKFFVLIFVFINANKLLSQNIIVSGQIISEVDKQPIVGVNILLVGSRTGTISDIDGKFAVNIHQNKKTNLRFSYTGFITENREIKCKMDTSLIIHLKEAIFDLNDVVVTATRTEKSLKDVPVLTQLIPAMRMKEIRGADISETLESYIPSINFSRGKFGDHLTMTGLDAKYVLFLVDGERMAGENYGNIDYSRLNTSNIEQIEVLKGASSTLYGSNAIGGVINIITKNVKEPFEVSYYSGLSFLKPEGINLSPVTINSINQELQDFQNNLYTGFKLNKFSSSTMIKQSQSYGFGYNKPSYLLKSDPNLIWNLNQKFKYDISDKLDAVLKVNYFSRERFEIDIIPIHSKYFNIGSNLKLNYKLNNKDNIQLSLNSDKYQEFDVFENKNEIEKTYDNILNHIRILGNIKLPFNQYFTIGSEYLSETLFSERIEGEIENVKDFTLFVQNDIKIGSKLNSIIGLRSNLNTIFGSKLVPQTSILYSLSNKIKIRGNFSMGYRTPLIKERYMRFQPTSGLTIYGNDTLVPENSYHYSFSTEYTNQLFNFSANIYYNKIKNQILELQTDKTIILNYDSTDIYSFKYFNVSEAEAYGIEFNLSKKFPFGFSLLSSFNVNRNWDKTRSRQIWGQVKNSGLIVISYKFQHKKLMQITSFHVKYTGETIYNELNEATLEYSENLVMPPHWVFKFVVNQEIYNWLSFNYGIDNIFNYNNIEYFIGVNPGRRIFAGLQIDFHELNFK